MGFPLAFVLGQPDGPRRFMRPAVLMGRMFGHVDPQRKGNLDWNCLSGRNGVKEQRNPAAGSMPGFANLRRASPNALVSGVISQARRTCT
jgi:hypothetical protein